MYIEKITLKNFRGASDLTVEFDKNLNVFYGENGAGKSTVLDAAAIMLSWVVKKISYAGGSGERIEEADVKNGQSFSSIKIVCVAEEQSIEWSQDASREGHGRDPNLYDNRGEVYIVGGEYGGLGQYTRLLQQKMTEYHEEVSLPLLLHYSVNRTISGHPVKTKEKKFFKILSAYNNALFGKSDFSSFFSWFKEREDLENEKKIDGDFNYSDKQLDTVRAALQKFMPKFNNLRIRRKPLRMEVEKDGQPFIINQLSDGEKMVLSMVGDVARRIAMLNPTLSDSLQGEGVVMIDEIDMHLHPKWQAVIVGKFIDVFPNIQFIISTHSPHVLNHVHPKNLFVLTQTPNNIEVSHPSESYGKDVVSILEDLMDTEVRPIPVREDLHELFVLIKAKKLDEAREQLQNLRHDIKDDAELLKAEILIRRMELIGQ